MTEFDAGKRPFALQSNGRSGKSMRTMLAALLVPLFCFLGAAAAQAQNIDWLVNIDDTVTPAPAGGLLDIPISVTNNGFDPAQATTIDIVVPDTTSFVSFSGDITNCSPLPGAAGATITCNVPPLASSETVEMLFGIETTVAPVSPDPSPVITATIPPVNSAGEADINTGGDPDNNTQTKTLTLQAGADIELTLPAPATAVSGEIIDLVFTATNNGPNDADSFTVSFPEPAGLSNIVAPPGCTLATGTYSCVVTGPIADGAGVDLTFEAQVSAGGGSNITLLANVIDGTPEDPDIDNNAVSPSITVTDGSDLAITKTVNGAEPLLVGDTTSFTLTPSFVGDEPTNVQITDTVPGNYTVTSVSPAPNCTFNAVSGDVVCDFATGADLTTITIDVTIDNPGFAENTANIISADTPDPNPSNDEASDDGITIEAPFIDLAVSKTGVSPALFVVGQSYDFELSATNVGNTEYTGTIEIRDVIPVGLTVTGVAGWACGPVPLVGDGSAELICTRDYNDPPGGVGVDVETDAAIVTVEITQPGSFTNIATVSAGPDSNFPDNNPGNDTSAPYNGTSQDPGNSADVTINKTVSPANLPVGQELTFEIEAVNNGTAESENVVVTDTFNQLINNSTGATGAGLVSVDFDDTAFPDISCGTAPLNGPSGTAVLLTCNIPTLAVCTAGSDCPVFTVTVRPGGEGEGRTNTAAILSNGTPDPDRDNNTADASYAVTPQFDLTIDKVASATEVNAGQLLTYVISGINKDDGLSSAPAVTISDTLPDDLTFVSATPSSGTCGTTPTEDSTTGPGNNTVECLMGTVGIGTQQTVTIEVRPNFDLISDPATVITNSASISSPSSDEIGVGDETDAVSVTIIPSSLDLLVQKTETEDPVELDGVTTYLVTIRNLGPSAAEDIRLVDTLPTSNIRVTGYDDGDGDAGTDRCSLAGQSAGLLGGTLTCDYPYLAAGETIVVSVTAEGDSKGTALNNAVVSSRETDAGLDGNMSNNDVDETTTVRTRSDVEVTSKVATPGTVNLRDPFIYTIRAAVNVGPGLVEADDVVISDNLPSNMELTGTPTVSLVQGAVSSSICTDPDGDPIVAGDTSFICSLGTFEQNLAPDPDQPGIVDITVPVRVTTITSDGQSFDNTALIETSSLDSDSTNNEASGAVIVNASTLSGTVFRDFNDDGTQDADDTNVGGVTLTLMGTALDGTTFTRTTTTDPVTGAYSFGLLPEGSYSVTRAAISETFQNDGDSYTSGGNGTASSPTLIDNITLGGNSTAPDNNFTIVPVARIGIAKQARGATVINPDGSFEQQFRLRVENFSLEALGNVAVTDVLQGAAPAFGTYSAGPLSAGEYTIAAAPTTNCGAGTANGAFTGAGDTTVASGITIAATSECRVDFTVQVQPTIPLPAIISGTDRYENSATVTGDGVLSGQTSATNPLLQDASVDGTNADPTNDGQADNDTSPTLVGPNFAPGIAIVKQASTTGFSTPPAENDQITYTFTVTNTGNIDLKDVVITDPLPGIMITDANIGDLDFGQSVMRTATYAITQDDIDAGEVQNTATATGQDIYGTTVDDDSGTTNGDDTPTVTPIQQVPGVAIIKRVTANGVQNPTVVGDTITYAFDVRNTGNVRLTNVTVTDPLPGLVLTGSPIALMEPGDEVIAAYTASYDVTAPDINAGEVENQATATGTDPDGASTDDLSGATYAQDAPVEVPLFQNPAIALIKTATTTRLGTPPQENDEIDYQFTVTNTGNVSLTNITITDLLPGVVVSGGPISLDINQSDSTTFTAIYPIAQTDLNDGEVENLATVSGTPPSGPAVTDDSGTDNASDDPLETPLDQVSSIQLVKRADLTALSTPPEDGETITFRFDVTNTGNQTLTNITLTDNLPGAMVTGGPIATLQPGVTDTTTFTATFDIDQDDLDLGSVTNTASVTGQDPDADDVTDDDTLVTNFTKDPGIAVIKEVDRTALSTPPQVGETLTYNFTITNTGNVRLTNVTLTDPLPDLVLTGSPIPLMQPGEIDTGTYSATYVLKETDLDAGQVQNQAHVEGTDPDDVVTDDLSGDTNADDNPLITPLAADPSIAVIKTADATGLSDPVQEGDIISYSFTITNTGNVTLTNVTLTDLLPDIMITGGPIVSLPSLAVDTTTFEATYVVKQSDIDLGEVENSATATGTPPVGPDVDDTSGSDNTNDDPTVVPLPQMPGITLDKIADTSEFLDGSLPGEAISYSFVITNTGNVTLTNVTVTDALAGVVLSGGPIASLAPSAVDDTTYTAEYVIDQGDIDAGLVINDATVTGDFNDILTGAAGQVDDSDTEEAIVANIEALPEPFAPFETDGGVTTSVLESDTFLNEPATLDTVTITVLDSDPEITLDPATGLITMPPGTPAGSYEVTYEICSIEFPTICDTTTETVIQLPLPSIETTKTQRIIDNGDGVDGVGDTVAYAITVANTGNVPVTNVMLNDTLTALDGTPFDLTTGPDFTQADMGSPEGDLEIGETANYVATFIVTIEAVTRGGLENTVVATALPVFPDDVPGTAEEIDDVSDDGFDDDGNTEDDPTTLVFDPDVDGADLSITKTTTANIVVRGQTVPYVIMVTNDSPFAAGPLDLVDTLPNGFLYTQGSATYGGASAEVVVTGAVVTWPDIIVPPLTTVTATLSATVLTGADAGNHINTASLLDSETGDPVAPDATAEVRIDPEPVFDCGDVIGKVFNDRNGNGYQDGPLDRSGAITDQTYYGGKGGGKLAPEPAPTDEPGIPAARLATVDGTIITADQFGRFSIPCAALPQDRGSNFILKLDTRSLPSGFRLTTENPRVVRLTPGKMVEMNFGVSISRLVRIDLNPNGFVIDADGTLALSGGLAQGIRTMLPQIADTPSHLRLAFHVSATADRSEIAEARAMMNAVQRYIDDIWRDIGQVKLTTEQTIVRPDQ